ncbi:DUF3757 domain-containing protein [Pseudomonas sp. RA_35y_Pfl2_P32]|uniref:DUF3757 domain-containing protein n=1 Tax=Pseudomonas sp. RA_35y_Pfl2_P32 TaxID=3088705 RepID=UPI0030DAB29B
MSLKKLAMSAVMLLVLAGNAFADIATCPYTANIKQKKEDQGFSYSAPGPHGYLWVGENPYAEEEDIKTFKFTGALYRDVSSEGNTEVVSCDYEGDALDAFARLTLYSFKGWAPVPGKKWTPQPDKEKGGAYKKAKNLLTCDALAPEDCAFNYRLLFKPPSKTAQAD